MQRLDLTEALPLGSLMQLPCRGAASLAVTEAREQGEMGRGDVGGQAGRWPQQLWVQHINFTACDLSHIVEGFLAWVDRVEAADSGGLQEAPPGGQFRHIRDVTPAPLGSCWSLLI